MAAFSGIAFALVYVVSLGFLPGLVVCLKAAPARQSALNAEMVFYLDVSPVERAKESREAPSEVSVNPVYLTDMCFC